MRARLVVVTGLAVFMGFLDATIVNIAFPDIERSFPDTGREDLSWVLNSYNVVFAALLVPAGRFADRIGRRRFFFTGLFVFVAASGLCAAAPSAEVLIAARVLQAAGAAIVIPTSLALLLPAFPIDQRATAVGLWGIGAASAAAAGPSLGGLIVDQTDWRWVFLVNLPIGAVVYLVGRNTIEEAREERGAPRPDIVGAVLLAACMGALALGIVKGEEWGWSSGRVLASFAFAAGAGAFFALRSRRHPAPVIEGALLRVRSFAVGNAGTLLFAVAFYALLLNNVLFMTTVWDYSLLSAGGALTTTPATTAILAAPFGRLADRVGHRTLIVPGCLLYAGAATWFATQCGDDPAFVSEWLPGGVMAGVGIALAFPVLASASVSELVPSRFGTGSAINAAARQIGAVLGVAIIVAIVGTPSPGAAPGAFDDGWTVMAIVTLAAAVTALFLPRTATHPAVEPEHAATPA
jgi:EmrB/QacA subfamily drug resistance transporter